MTIRALYVLCFLCAIAAPAAAHTWQILPDGSGDAPTIQAGIEAAAHHDTVLVDPGTYYEMLDFLGKKVTVGSRFLLDGDSTWIRQTVVDASHDYGSVVLFVHDEEPLSILAGLTLQGGQGSAAGFVLGGGIYIGESSPTLHDLVVRQNGATHGDMIGGGIYIGNSSPLLDRVVVEENDAGYYGGGIAVAGESAHPVIRDCTIRRNWSNGTSGLDLYVGARATVRNTAIYDNTGSSPSFHQVVLLDVGCRLDLINNTVSGNNGGLMVCNNSSLVLVNSILWGNEDPEILCCADSPASVVAISHCDLAGGLDGIETNGNADVQWLEGNIDEDPDFVDPASDDYTLSSGSPCLDAGVAHFEYDGELLVDLGPEDYCGQAPDMGAFELCLDPSSVWPEAASIGASWDLRDLRMHPNPTRGGAVLSFDLARPVPVRVTVHDVAGRLVALVAEGDFGPGPVEIGWDGRGVSKEPVPAGAYWTRVVAGETVRATRLLVIR